MTSILRRGRSTRGLSSFASYNTTEMDGDEIARVVLNTFEGWPRKGKPLNRGGGVKEWVPLSGIVARRKDTLTCIAAATGMKCLPQNRIQEAKGIVLHDWHAEILAIRAFNRFLLEECHALAISPRASSEYIRLRSEDEMMKGQLQPFALQDEVELHMYCSEAPCGDASMELTMASQADPTPWALPRQTDSPISEDAPSSLMGRSHFSSLGVVRRKPSRPDAPPTLSKSCSDKLALKQCTSLISSISSLLISPSNCYLKTLVLPETQFSETACTRAFSLHGRMRDLQDAKWGQYAFRPFEVKTTKMDFAHSRRQSVSGGEKIVPSNISSSWIAEHTGKKGDMEVLIGGILQGRKMGDFRGASKVCKRRTWKLAIEIATLINTPQIRKCLEVQTYARVKSSHHLQERAEAKEQAQEKCLRGWIRNAGGEDFAIDGNDK